MAKENGSLTQLVRELRARVAELERQVADLMSQSKTRPEKDWQRTIGMFAGNEGMKEIDRLGAEYRANLRQRSQHAKTSRKKVKT